MQQEVIKRINARVTRVLTMAEAALPPSQFQAFRKLVLEEFGDRGLKAELRNLPRGRE